MRRSRLFGSLAVAAGLAAAVAATTAQPPAGKADAPDLSTLEAIQPFPAADGDSPLRKLQKERFNTRLEAAKLQTRALRAGALSLQDFNGLLMVIAQNGADVADTAEDRAKWLQMRVDVMKSQEELAKKRSEAGAENAASYLLTKAARIDAEIDLLKAKDGGKADRGSGEKK